MLIDRFIGCLFLCLCALLWFVIIPQQISGEEQAMYPRLTIIFLAIPALFMALRTTGKNIVLTPLLLLGVIYGIVVFFLNYPLPSGILF